MATVATTIKMYDGMSSGLRRMVSSMDKMYSSFKSVQSIADNPVNVQAFEEARQEIEKANGHLDDMEENIRKNTQQQDRFTQKTEQSTSAMQRLINKTFSLRGALAAVGGVMALKQGIDAIDNNANNKARLGLITNGDLKATKDLQNEIFNTAINIGAAYSNMQNEVAKFKLLSGKAFKTNEDALFLVDQMNKHFMIGGTDRSGREGAMLQLQQGLSSGALQGDEARSIRENAPLIKQAIEDQFNGISFKELSAQGLITSDVIMQALVATADVTNAKFAQLPMTFARMWTNFKSHATKAFEPVMNRITEITNTQKFQVFVSNMTNGLYRIADATLWIVDKVVALTNAFVESGEIIIPAIWGIVAALVVYNATMGGGWLLTLKKIAANAIFAVSEFFMALATKAHMVAQLGLNAAIASCPITWIIIAIIALIVIIFAVIASIIKFQTQAESSIGVIVGMFHWMAAIVKNILVALWNFWVGAFEILVNMLITFAKFFANFLNNPTKAIIELIFGMANFIIDQVKLVAQAIDDLFGTNFTAGIQVFQDKLKPLKDELVSRLSLDTGLMKEVDIPDVDFSKFKLERVNMADAYQEGYLKGATWEANRDNLDPTSLLDTPGTGGAIDQIANNTGRGADAAEDQKNSMEQAVEELKWQRDMAEANAINRFTTAEIKIEMNNENIINDANDLDGIVSALEEKVSEAMESSANGVYK